MFRLIFVVLVIGAQAEEWFGESIVDSAKIQHFEDQIRLDSNKLCVNWWQAMDTDCNDVVDNGEAVDALANHFGKDPVLLQTVWDANKSNCTQNYWVRDKPVFMAYVLSEVYMSVGRIDRTPCAVNPTFTIISSTFRFQSGMKRIILDEDFIDKVSFSRFCTGFFRYHTQIEAFWFDYMDLNEDRCLSASEWASWMRRQGSFWKDRYELHWRSLNLTFPEFSEIAAYRPPFYAMEAFANEYAYPCVTAQRFAIWSLFSVMQATRPIGNNTALCLMNASEQHQGQMDSASTLALDSDESHVSFIIAGAAGFAGILILVCALILACRRKNARKIEARRVQNLLSVQNLLKAKLDAWSTFDCDLEAKTSSLEPSMLHCLSLGRFRPEVICLLQLAHPDDVPSLQSALSQVKASRDKFSVPVLTTVRLLHGAFSSPEHGKTYLQKYTTFEILMTWCDENSTIVGLTQSSESHLVPAAPLHDVVDQALNPQLSMALGERSSFAGEADPSLAGCEETSSPENIINGSDLVSVTGSDAETFRSMYATSHQGGQMVDSFSRSKFTRFPARLNVALAHAAIDLGVRDTSTSDEATSGINCSSSDTKQSATLSVSI